MDWNSFIGQWNSTSKTWYILLLNIGNTATLKLQGTIKRDLANSTIEIIIVEKQKEFNQEIQTANATIIIN